VSTRPRSTALRPRGVWRPCRPRCPGPHVGPRIPRPHVSPCRTLPKPLALGIVRSPRAAHAVRPPRPPPAPSSIGVLLPATTGSPVFPLALRRSAENPTRSPWPIKATRLSSHAGPDAAVCHWCLYDKLLPPDLTTTTRAPQLLCTAPLNLPCHLSSRPRCNFAGAAAPTAATVPAPWHHFRPFSGHKSVVGEPLTSPTPFPCRPRRWLAGVPAVPPPHGPRAQLRGLICSQGL
jgi:hypothetical protein